MKAAMKVHRDAPKCSEFQLQQVPKQAPDFTVHADLCSLPQRAGTGLHRVELVLSQWSKRVFARQKNI